MYPICTIRSTPDKPVHCVVWAKELFKLMFGNPADSLLDEPVDDGPDQSVGLCSTDTNKTVFRHGRVVGGLSTPTIGRSSGMYQRHYQLTATTANTANTITANTTANFYSMIS